MWLLVVVWFNQKLVKPDGIRNLFKAEVYEARAQNKSEIVFKILNIKSYDTPLVFTVCFGYWIWTLTFRQQLNQEISTAGVLYAYCLQCLKRIQSPNLSIFYFDLRFKHCKIGMWKIKQLLFVAKSDFIWQVWNAHQKAFLFPFWNCSESVKVLFWDLEIGWTTTTQSFIPLKFEVRRSQETW